MALFVSGQNRKCQRFFSFCRLARGSLSNAFLLPWMGAVLYAFPLISLLHKVLLKVKKDKAKVIPVALAWPHQH